MNAPADDREGFAAFLLRMRSRGLDNKALARLTKVGSRFDREDIAQVRLQPLTAGLAKVL